MKRVVSVFAVTISIVLLIGFHIRFSARATSGCIDNIYGYNEKKVNYIVGKLAEENEQFLGEDDKSVNTISDSYKIGDMIFIRPGSDLYDSASGAMQKDLSIGGVVDDYQMNLSLGYTWSGVITKIYNKWTPINSVAIDEDPNIYTIFLSAVYRSGQYYCGGSYVRLDDIYR